MRGFVLGLSLACALLVLAGLVPSDNPVLDTISFFRPVFAAGAALGLVVAKGRLRWGLVALILFATASIWAAFPEPQPGDDLRLYTKNIRYDNVGLGPLHDDILISDVDVVTLQELSVANIAILEDLKPDFPHQAVCGTGEPFFLAVLSKTPFLEEPRCGKTHGVAAAPLQLEGGPVWVVSVHWPWPWPANGARTDTDMRGVMAGLTGPVVLAGDFNTLPWTQRLAWARSLSRTKRAGPTPLTLWHRRLRVPLPLDYVFAPAGGTVEARLLFGSDHLGLVANLSVFGAGG